MRSLEGKMSKKQHEVADQLELHFIMCTLRCICLKRLALFLVKMARKAQAREGVT